MSKYLFFIGWYAFVSFFFGVLLVNSYLYLFKNLYFPSNLYNISIGLICFGLIIISFICPYIYKDEPRRLKTIVRIKDYSYAILLTLTSIFLIFILPMEFNEWFIEGAWALSLVFFAISSRIETFYLWSNIEVGTISIQFGSIHHLFHFLNLSFHFFLGQYLLRYYAPFAPDRKSVV